MAVNFMAVKYATKINKTCDKQETYFNIFTQVQKIFKNLTPQLSQR